MIYLYKDIFIHYLYNGLLYGKKRECTIALHNYMLSKRAQAQKNTSLSFNPETINHSV